MSFDQTDIPLYHVIVMAAGIGTRAKTKIPKQYVYIEGKSILRHTLDNILSWKYLGSLRVVIHPDHKELYQKEVIDLYLHQPIFGGKERKDSVYNALKLSDNIKDEDIILVHDAARPFTKWADVRRLLEALKSDRAATLTVPVSDTLRRAKSDKAGPIVSRDNLWAIQTPQGFIFKDLKAAHENASPDLEYTDDTSLVSEAGIAVNLVPGSMSNIKITTDNDLTIAREILAKGAEKTMYETRTGIGYDVHQLDFDNEENKPFVLCGIELNFPAALKGHSDADVALHAITDALLGAMALGDIGQHFPPTDERYKNMDSAFFLSKTLEYLTNSDGKINNIDLIIICETPKIGPYRNEMQKRVADLCNIEPSRINIKATTTEKLGFTGRREGIAAQAIATISLPRR